MDSTIRVVDFSVKLYVSHPNGNSAPFQYGDVLAIHGKPFQIPNPKNPHEFNYAKYMRDHGFIFQHFVTNERIKHISSDAGNPVMSAIYRTRGHFHSILESRIESKRERAVASALLLGKKDDLDSETKQAFATAGAMHVLAVSGLHVGVIYLFLLWGLKAFKSRNIEVWVLPFVSVLTLWFYALLVGFSPSIFRAVVMFTVIILGKSLNRQVNIYNSISVSAFILLLANPMNLFSVGFQLSYLAVIGIVFVYDKLYPTLIAPNWLLDKIWSLSCISIAAQLATAPISIYYFNQFPTFFLFSNLIVIPVAFLVMILGILLLFIGTLDISQWLGLFLEVILKWLNLSVSGIQALPGSKINWLFLSPIQVLLIYVVIGSALIFLFYKKKEFFWIELVSIFFFVADRSYFIYEQSKDHKTIFYSTRKNLLVDHISGLNASLSSLDTISNIELAAYQVHPNRLASYLGPIENPEILKNSKYQIGNFATLDVRNQNKFLYVYNSIPDGHAFKIETDYLILSGKKATTDLSVINKIRFKKLIINSYSTRINKTIRGKLEKEGISISALKDRALIIQN